jgi:carbamoyltransferase
LVNNEEYKVMALAALGDAGAVPDIAQLVEESADGSFALVDRFFAYRGGMHMWSNELEKLLGIPRARGSTIEKRHRDIAAGLQKLTERVYAAIVREAYRIAPSTNLCLGGGVALNAVANGIVFDQGPFRALHIWGAAGDSGAACGAALYVDRAYSERSVPDSAVSLCVGTSYADGAYAQAIKDRRVTVRDYDDDQVAMEIARRVSLGDVVAVFDGPMEFGPRALGNRSLFAHPALASSIRKLHAIKARETYRPFGGIYFSDRLHEYAVVPHGYRSYPCMNVCLRALDPANIPAIVHVDGTCRVQTVERASDSASRAAHVLTEFEKQTGLGCILNTSFNTNGEPLVEHPVQAVNTFLALPIDSLFLGRYLLTKRTE